MSRWCAKLVSFVLFLIVFLIPFDRKHDRLFRHISKALIPDGFALPPYFEKKIYFYLSDAAIVFLFLLALFALRIPIRRLLFENGAPFLLLLFFWALISLWASALGSCPIMYTRLLQLVTPLLLFSYLAASPPKTNLIFGALLSAALLQSFIAIAQYFTQSYLGLKMLGEPLLPTGTFPSYAGHRWILDSLSDYKAPSLLLMRVSGTMPHCNNLGGFLSISILATYSIFLTTSKSWLRPLLAICILLQFFALNLTFSRAALFSWAIGTLVWALLSIRQMGIRPFLANSAMRTLSLIIAFSLMTTFTLLYQQIFDRGGIVNYNATALGSDTLRLTAQSTSLQILSEHPLLGVGYQQLPIAAARYNMPPTHNIYLFLASEIGLVGLALFLLLIGLLCYRALRGPPSPHLPIVLAMFAALLFIGACDFYHIAFQHGRLVLFTVAGLLGSLVRPATSALDKKL